ncbi:hypothetical protein ANTQUA_LOCUS3884 [Anthophora quadrimaculata]
MNAWEMRSIIQTTFETNRRAPCKESRLKLSGKLQDHILEKIIASEKKISLDYVEYPLSKESVAKLDTVQASDANNRAIKRASSQRKKPKFRSNERKYRNSNIRSRIEGTNTTDHSRRNSSREQGIFNVRRREYFESLGHVSSPRVRHVCISWDTVLELPLCGPSVTAYPPSSSSFSRTYVVNAGQTVGEVT